MKKSYKRLSMMVPVIAITPIVALVACNENSNSETPAKGSFENFDKKTLWTSNFSSNDVAKGDFEVPEDGLYLLRDSYKGKAWDGTNKDGHEVTENVSRIYGGLFDKSVIEFGDGDSLYVLYDKDDKDEFSPSEFNNQFYFNDSSIMDTDELRTINNTYGNTLIKTIWGDVSHVAFKDGKSTQYIGSQSNHMGNLTFEQSMDKIKTQVSSTEYSAIEKYYTHASHVFMPVMHKEGMFSYERVSERAYKITYHYDATEHNPITAATFKLFNRDKDVTLSMGTLSMGETTEWTSYENPSSGNVYYFQGRKNN